MVVSVTHTPSCVDEQEHGGASQVPAAAASSVPSLLDPSPEHVAGTARARDVLGLSEVRWALIAAVLFAPRPEPTHHIARRAGLRPR